MQNLRVMITLINVSIFPNVSWIGFRHIALLSLAYFLATEAAVVNQGTLRNSYTLPSDSLSRRIHVSRRHKRRHKWRHIWRRSFPKTGTARRLAVAPEERRYPKARVSSLKVSPGKSIAEQIPHGGICSRINSAPDCTLKQSLRGENISSVLIISRPGDFSY